jgi:hypothetical protein
LALVEPLELLVWVEVVAIQHLAQSLLMAVVAVVLVALTLA